MNEYFISYNCNDKNTNESFFGNSFIKMETTISGFEDILNIARCIEKEGGYSKGSVVIINFKRFEHY